MRRFLKAALVLALAGALPAAAGPVSAQMADAHQVEVTITNLTAAQVLSPPIVISHAADTHVWQLGALASDEVRAVAETGDTSALAAKYSDMSTAVVALDAPLPPGESVTVTIATHEGDVVSALAMLVQTNDGFTGLDGLAPGMSDMTRAADAYDAGTEDNTEMASHVPGPPFGGTDRAPTTPQAPIAMHPGIAGNADVGSEYAWDGPVAEFTVRPQPAMMPRTGGAGLSVTTLLALAGAALLGLGLGARVARQQEPA